MTAYRQSAGVSETAVDEDLFLVPMGGADVYHLNPLGAALWRLLAEPASAEEAADLLAAAFPDASGADLAQDVSRFLAEMLRRGLISAT